MANLENDKPNPQTVAGLLDTQKSWEPFRKAGLLWFVNRMLHVFGWAIVMECEDDGTIIACYPRRVVYRGFDEKTEDEGYKNVAWFLSQNAHTLYDEAGYEMPGEEKE
jgi:hypothetical protein